ncbi:MAG: hypothetical protein QME94_15130 [Anaerolineae bacterium]|nr:hypothetical protein [Anaerolineae bacterium]
MVWWLPDRLVEQVDREKVQLSYEREDRIEEGVAARAHPNGPIPEERGLTTRWREEVSRDTFIAALRALADALSQQENFTFAVDHRFMLMRPLGTPSIEYLERENQRKEVIFRFAWRA